jgi:hypothetical protein
VLEGDAVVLLSDPGRPVALPVRGGLLCEDDGPC